MSGNVLNIWSSPCPGTRIQTSGPRSSRLLREEAPQKRRAEGTKDARDTIGLATRNAIEIAYDRLKWKSLRPSGRRQPLLGDKQKINQQLAMAHTNPILSMKSAVEDLFSHEPRNPVSRIFPPVIPSERFSKKNRETIRGVPARKASFISGDVDILFHFRPCAKPIGLHPPEVIKRCVSWLGALFGFERRLRYILKYKMFCTPSCVEILPPPGEALWSYPSIVCASRVRKNIAIVCV